MSIRCAVCGSKNVVIKTKKEGYDVTKGVVGTVLVGLPGALAGAGGKENLYYHCADCGQVLNRPMVSVHSDFIDRIISFPEAFDVVLKEEKARYKNIEWEDTTQGTDTAKENYSYEPISDMEIIDFLSSKGGAFEERLLEEHFKPRFLQLSSLISAGRIKLRMVGDQQYIQLVTDLDEIEKLCFEQQEKKENYDIILSVLEKHTGKYTVSQLQKMSSKLDEMSYQKISALLKGMVEEGMVEKIVECKVSYFAKAGYQELQNKRREKLESQRPQFKQRYSARYPLLKEKNKLKEQMEDAQKEINKIIKKYGTSPSFSAGLLQFVSILSIVLGVIILFVNSEMFGVAVVESLAGILVYIWGKKIKELAIECESYKKTVDECKQKLIQIEAIPSFEKWFQEEIERELNK